MACSKALGLTAVAMAASAPPRRWMAATGSCSPTCTRCSAPSSRADSRRSALVSTATTAAPVARAYWIARCPRPPTPNTATRLAEVAPDTFTALYVVTPAQVRGAASSGLTSAGTRTTWRV